MAEQGVFHPNDAATTVNIAATTSSARVAVNTAPTGRNLRIHNAGAALVFFEFGGSGINAAVATGIPIPAGAVEIFRTIGSHVAAITASGTATLYITPGEGA